MPRAVLSQVDGWAAGVSECTYIAHIYLSGSKHGSSGRCWLPQTRPLSTSVLPYPTMPCTLDSPALNASRLWVKAKSHLLKERGRWRWGWGGGWLPDQVGCLIDVTGSPALPGTVGCPRV